jgi:hypothetical protein
MRKVSCCSVRKARLCRHVSSAVLVAVCILITPANGWILPRHGPSALAGICIRPGEAHPRPTFVNRQKERIPMPVDRIMLYAHPRIPDQTNNFTYSSPSEEKITIGAEEFIGTIQEVFLSYPMRSIPFSILMAASGAILGPFLDSYHSLFGVLQYDAPITAVLWGADVQHPALITTDWVPGLFGLAGFLIGWLYILLDAYFAKVDSTSVKSTDRVENTPSPPKILLGIALFTFQYWWSGVLYHAGVDRTVILSLMTLSAAFGFSWLDNTRAGLITSLATAIGGPLIEVFLLTLSNDGLLFDGKGYHYNDLGKTGYFPLWIVPVYFLGGPANGNLARGFWQLLSSLSLPQTERNASNQRSGTCTTCNDTRCVPCPNWYVVF